MRVLVTGASAGLGRALVEEHLDRGDEVWGLSRRRPEDLIARGLRHGSIDLAGLEAIRPDLEALVGAAGRFDLVWLNAGVLGEIRDLADSDLASLQATFDVDVWANKVVIDALMSAGPAPRRVLALSSGAAVRGQRGWGGYAIAKAALNMLVQLEAAERPETWFLALAPGLVDTAMQAQIRALPADPRFASLERLKAAHGTVNMPEPRAAARRLLAALPALETVASGGFVDIRDFGG
ncbi:MAG: SDR family NAD(P)-dependent oxidoreductase [Planctomycetes bacterium]|nr:SDR family NAD(P)-dependent oxidoreductase [Planctomycetota bacterium]